MGSEGLQVQDLPYREMEKLRQVMRRSVCNPLTLMLVPVERENVHWFLEVNSSHVRNWGVITVMTGTLCVS